MLIVEDGSGKTDSQTYASEAVFLQYWTERGVTVAGEPSELLLRAMDYLEQQNFKGYKYTQPQALQWPRSGVWIDGYAVAIDEIPLLLVEAQCEYGLSIDTGESPLATVGRATKKEKVDVIEVTYQDNASDSVYLAAAGNKLRKLVRAGGSSGAVLRG
jgi:hypothetical protein